MLSSDPFGNALIDAGIDYFLSSGTGLLPGETATFDVGTIGEFANEGFAVLMHHAPNSDFPTWLLDALHGRRHPVRSLGGDQRATDDSGTIGIGAAYFRCDCSGRTAETV